MFVLLSAHGFGGMTDADPTRVAAQIVSGIGFLGAGVILRDGGSVRGLNTAATLWCSAAVGALAGAGLYAVAAMRATAILAANILLRWVARAIDKVPQNGSDHCRRLPAASVLGAHPALVRWHFRSEREIDRGADCPAMQEDWQARSPRATHPDPDRSEPHKHRQV